MSLFPIVLSAWGLLSFLNLWVDLFCLFVFPVISPLAFSQESCKLEIPEGGSFVPLSPHMTA